MNKLLSTFAVLSLATAAWAGPTGHPGEAKACCKTKAAAELKAMDAKLDELVTAMKDAQGDRKIDAMAAVITELASQRKALCDTLFATHHGDMAACTHEKGATASKKGGCPMKAEAETADAKVAAKEEPKGTH